MRRSALDLIRNVVELLEVLHESLRKIASLLVIRVLVGSGVARVEHFRRNAGYFGRDCEAEYMVGYEFRFVQASFDLPVNVIHWLKQGFSTAKGTVPLFEWRCIIDLIVKRG